MSTARLEASALAVTWIPSEALPSVARLPFDHSLLHYDSPPPDRITDLPALLAADRFRFANELTGWVEVVDGRIATFGGGGGAHMGQTKLRFGPRQLSFAGVSLPELRPAPEVHEDRVRFVQTAGGRTGVPAPRPVPRPPYVQFSAPIAWTTLALTLHADGRVERELIGASAFPRHWLYNEHGELVAKSAVMDFTSWMAAAFGTRTPWGSYDDPAVTAAAETALERELSTHIMRGGDRPQIRALPAGATLVEQGSPAAEVFLLLDGILEVVVDGQIVAEVGPGAVLGERGLLEGGRRTATLRATTRCRVAAVPGDRLDPAALSEVSREHRREEG